MQTFTRRHISRNLSRIDANTSSTLNYKSKPDDDKAENTEINSKSQIVSDVKKTSSTVSGDAKKARVKRVISTTLDNNKYLTDIKSLKEWYMFMEKNEGKVVSVRFYSHVCKVRIFGDPAE